MRTVVAAIEAEFRRYKLLAEAAIEQLSDEQLCTSAGQHQSSVATIVWHVAGNLRSRFSEFLTADGEKPWRDRESEFLPRRVTRSEALETWQGGWDVLTAEVSALTDADLARTVRIRGQGLSVLEALQRSLAHASYHVGQIVFLGKMLRGGEWKYLSIPPGESARYNQNPDRERPPGR